jgi:hypothetical protein
MTTRDDELLDEARGCWKGGDYLNAGKALFTRVPAPKRGEWACRVLRDAAPAGRFAVPAVQELLDLCENPQPGHSAKAVFSSIRASTLKLERLSSRTREQDVLLDYLYLAENVAKVVYNATQPHNPFDEDAGWWITVCLRALLESDAVANWEQEAWRSLAALV